MDQVGLGCSPDQLGTDPGPTTLQLPRFEQSTD